LQIPDAKGERLKESVLPGGPGEFLRGYFLATITRKGSLREGRPEIRPGEMKGGK